MERSLVVNRLHSRLFMLMLVTLGGLGTGVSAGAARNVVSVVSVPTAVVGGKTFKIRVTLNAANGSTVALRFFSHDLDAAQFSNVAGTIPDGVSQKDFVFTTVPVASDQIVEYTAAHVDATGKIFIATFLRQITVRSPRVTSLELNPLNPSEGITPSIVIVGGSGLLGIIQLSGPAPATGAKVALSNSRPDLVQIPAEIMVPPGDSRVEFLVTTAAVPSAVSLQLSAEREGQSQGATLTLARARPIEIRLGWVLGGPQPLPPFISGASLIPAQVLLDAPAAGDGMTLVLDADETLAVDLPDSVFVPRGADRVQFAIASNGVSDRTTVAIRARDLATGSSAQGSLVVEPPAIQWVEISPATVVGGQEAFGVVYLRGVAAPEGVSIMLHSSSPAVSLPNPLNIPSGLKEVGFSVMTSRVMAEQGVEITASIPGQTPVGHSLRLLPAELGDVDGNGALNSDDYKSLAGCLRGPAVSATADCRAVFGFAISAVTVDLRDVGVFLTKFTGNLSGVPRIIIDVDETLDPIVAQLGPLDGAPAGPRPVAAMAADSDEATYFVENELALIVPDTATLNAFLQRWQGVLLDSVDLPQPGAKFCLARVNPDWGNSLHLDRDLAEMFIASGAGPAPEPVVRLALSSERAKRLLSIAVKERLSGLLIGPNWIPLPQDISGRSTEEAPMGPGTYEPDTFCWDYLMSGDGKDIGVTEAWRVLDAAGRLTPNSVDIAVIDGGCQITSTVATDLPNLLSLPNPAMDLTNADPNPVPCSDGTPCPFHCVDVLSTAMGKVDNNHTGSAGPAGPVGKAIVFVPPNGSSRLDDITTVAMAVLREANGGSARIFNMSAAAKVHWIVGSFADLLLGLFDGFDIIRDDILIFASAGNDGKNIDKETRLGYERYRWIPCELNNIICVGGIDVGNCLTRHPGSNFGNEDVDIWAPFTVWAAPSPDKPFVHEFPGTSASSPFVAGVAALVWAGNPTLSARDVKEILFDNASPSPDATVKRVVTALDAVLDPRVGLPGTPPSICILFPDDGTSCDVMGPDCPNGGVGPTTTPTACGGPLAGASFVSEISAVVPTARKRIGFYLSAEIFDREAGFGFCSAPQVVWTSNRQTGSIASGISGDAILNNDGLHTITATVTDCTGMSASDSVVVNVLNDRPSVRLLLPVDATEYCADETIEFVAEAFDPNEPPTYRLPSSRILWSSSRQGSIGQGSSFSRVLSSAGTHTITVRGTDVEGAVDADTTAVTILPEPCDLIAMQVTTPPRNLTNCTDGLFVTGTDAARGLRFRDVTLEGEAFDAQDGWLTGTSLTWRTDQTDIQSAVLGSGERITARLYLVIGEASRLHRITLTAKDSNGNLRSVTRLVMLCDII